MVDAITGAFAGEGLGRAIRIVEDGVNYGSTLSSVNSTIENLKQPILQIQQYNQQMGLPAHEDIEKVMESMAACEKVISKSQTGWWNLFLRPYYKRKLDESHESLVTDITIQMLVRIMMCLKGIQSKWNGHDENDSHSLPSFQGNHENHEMNPRECDLPTRILDGQLMNKLKFEVLRNGDKQVLNLTGMPGLGKTTLAKQLCRDTQVNGKFMGNVVFEALGLQINESGVQQVENKVKYKLGEIGNRPVLLVLDDVGPASKNLVDKFKTQISPDSKILVISRVAFPEFGTPHQMRELAEEDAKSLLLYFVQPSNIDVGDPEIDDIVLQVVRGCKGVPLALKFMGSELRGKTIMKWRNVLLEWSQNRTILHNDSELLKHLQDSLRVLGNESINQCFTDLGLFPEDQRIPITALIDLWVELYKLDEEGICAMNSIEQLTNMNLADIIVRRENESGKENYYNDQFLLQHKILRELAIHISNGKETFEKRERLIFDINGNDRPEWWPQEQEQQGISACIPTFVPTWLIGPKHQRVAARKVSISIDQSITQDWCNIEAPEAEVLVLNLQTKDYTLPEFIKKMRNFKVFIVTNYGFQSHPTSELKNMEVLGVLGSLKRIRLERVSFPFLCRLTNVQNLSLYMCEVKKNFEDCPIPFSEAMPNLEELNIEYCKDLVKLPAGFCNIATMKKLCISNCHRFIELPEEIGKLENLEFLRVSQCANFEVMPVSITRLKKLTFLDISYCVSLRTLPNNIDELRKLTKLYMTGCPISELPESVRNMEHLSFVICDYYTYPLWEVKKNEHLSRLNIKMAKDTTYWRILGFGSSALFH